MTTGLRGRRRARAALAAALALALGGWTTPVAPPPPKPPARLVPGALFSEDELWPGGFRGEQILVLPDGRALVACRENGAWKALLVRLDPAGRLDRTLGAGKGVALVDLFYGDVALQGDGRIVVGGWRGGNRVGVRRVLENGEPDATFGDGGLAAVPLGPGSLGALAHAVALQADGRILVAGYSGSRKPYVPFNPFSELTVLRFQPNGSLDPSFGDHGVAIVPYDGPGNADGWALAPLPSGSALVAGSTFAGVPGGPNPAAGIAVLGTAGPRDRGPHVALARLRADGSPDPGFGGGGGRVADILGEVAGEARAVATLQDGKILVAGIVRDAGGPSGPSGLVLARFTAEGSPDPAFGEGGVLRPALCAGDQQARPMAVQPDGKIVVACPGAPETAPGAAPAAGQRPLRLMRYTADGAPDASFGDKGTVALQVFAGPLAKTAVALQADGAILVMCSGQEQPDAAGGKRQGRALLEVLRFRPDGSIDADYGAAKR